MILRKAIILEDGTEVKELQFSWESLSYSDLLSARKVKALVAKGSEAQTSISPKLDNELRIGIAWIAAMKANDKLKLNDILKLSLVDALELSDCAVDEYLL